MTSQEKEKELRGKVETLRQWFGSAELPAGPVQLCPGVKIIDVNKFVESSLARLESSNFYSLTLRMAYIHLIDFKNIIENANS